MSIPPLPKGMAADQTCLLANHLHSFAIHLLRGLRGADETSGLSPERLSVLSVVAFAGPITPSRLADVELVSRPAITKIIDALETMGLVNRQINPCDRRQIEIRITAMGEQAMELARKNRLEQIRAQLKVFSNEELELLGQAGVLLSKL